MNLTAEQRKIGAENFQAAQGQLKPGDFEMNRREFVGAAAAGLMIPAGAVGGFYFGYKTVNDPVRIGVIGTGDEGSVLIHNLNPDYVTVKAICDIRPYNIHRAFNGQTGAEHVRQGLCRVYGWKGSDGLPDRAQAEKHVKVYQDYRDVLKDPDIEAVIIAVPLHLHAPMVIDALKAGKHVLTEKLMGKTIGDCKQMARVSRDTNLLLATGHQRHYSVLYEQAKQMIRLGLLGDVHHIRAQWHRGNLPGKDSWKPKLPQEYVVDLEATIEKAEHFRNLITQYDSKDKKRADTYRAELRKQLDRMEDLKALVADGKIDPTKFGYEDFKINGSGPLVSAMEELIRWRLWNRTGGGLMAELGSHQLDAASIFLSAMRSDGKKVNPLSVSAVGGRHLFPADRECDDHVYCMYEFPGPDNYRTLDENGKPIQPVDQKVVVTYSSINGNGYGDWGEVVLGTEGTLIMDREQDVLLFGPNKSSYMRIQSDDSGMSMATADSGFGLGSVNAGGGGAGSLPGTSGPVSRGYKEEIEHWAWCIRNRDPNAPDQPETTPRCYPPVALADAVIALTANIAMAQNRRVEFKPEWFNIDDDATPEKDLIGGKPTFEVT